MAIKSSNPVFTRLDGFNGKNTQGNPTYQGNGQGYAGYGSPSTWSTGPGTATQGGTGQSYDEPLTHTRDQGRMTIDSVVQKTGITLAVLVLAAAATWVMTGDITDQAALRTLYTLSIVGALGGFALAMVNSFKKVVSPALVLAYAALEGVFIGAFSKTIQSMFGSDANGNGNGIVVGAVVGTIAAFAGTLAAYKFFDIKVGNRFRKWVTAAMFGFVGLVLLDFVLSLFHASLGLNGFGGLGLLMSVVGLGLGVLMLILDFDFVERGVAAGLPEQESWRAAFGLTVTIVWIYIELLRILAILRGN
ncbi:MAG: Bax inhibitor-1/YccA family protein [Marmoricola sp.]